MELDEFTRAYIACALWSSNDESTPEGGEPMDASYGIEDIAPETLERMRADCEDFRADEKTRECLKRLSVEQGGHNFWLTRNGHGAGFWDRGIGAAGDYLHQRAKVYGSCDLYVGDDGKVHTS